MGSVMKCLKFVFDMLDENGFIFCIKILQCFVFLSFKNTVKYFLGDFEKCTIKLPQTKKSQTKTLKIEDEENIATSKNVIKTKP